MESLNKAIGLACEKGGYKWKIDVSMESILLDALFWQNLGKALGWDDDERTIYKSRSGGSMGIFEGEIYRHNSWKSYWHKFIDHLASGKSPDEFFANLLSS